jgi:hypothetical protein
MNSLPTPFPGKIGAKEGQDFLVSLMLSQRCFVDVGCADGIFRNNTIFLERSGWRGCLFDKDQRAIESCRETRLSPALQIDAQVFDFKSFFIQHDVPRTIDYISFDVDGATERAFLNFPFEDYEFLIMTVEHDRFHCGPTRKGLIHERLSEFSHYSVLASDVQAGPGKPFEDWVINTRYSPPSLSAQKHEGMLWWDCIRNLTEYHCKGFPVFADKAS